MNSRGSLVELLICLIGRTPKGELFESFEPFFEKVYLVDELNRRVTRALAVVPKDPEESQCCRVDSYRAHIFTVLPTGYKRFLVVPVSLFGTEMPAGTLSDEIEDHERGGDYDLGILPVRNFSLLAFQVHAARVLARHRNAPDCVGPE
eukprot:g18586.t1